jgi:hypothetical protein
MPPRNNFGGVDLSNLGKCKQHSLAHLQYRLVRTPDGSQLLVLDLAQCVNEGCEYKIVGRQPDPPEE